MNRFLPSIPASRAFKRLSAITLFIALGLISPTVSFAEESSVKDGVKSFFSNTVKKSKEVISGTIEGIQEGATGSESLQEERIINDYDAFNESVWLSLETVTTSSWRNHYYTLDLRLHNHSDTPVRLTNLDRADNFILIDEQRFAHSVTTFTSTKDITLLPYTTAALELNFSGVKATPTHLRIYGQELALDGLIQDPNKKLEDLGVAIPSIGTPLRIPEIEPEPAP